ncbi:putative protein kinase RLK-Pelle-DLSV family [Helianthus annuus]|nr:putative protein kinase RLK-Pelle-DLSV family [Helianthus annuus]
MVSSRGKKQLKDERKIICNVHHRHLIHLLGYYRKGPHLFLVHEYMENHSLDQCDRTTTLSWKQRFGIIYGTARGLAYLHEQYHVTIIHRDINGILTSKLNARAYYTYMYILHLTINN